MARGKVKAEHMRRQALADKRLRGHRIKRGLEELGDLDAAPPSSAPPPAKRARPHEEAPKSPRQPRTSSPVDGAGGAAQTTASYKSVYGDGWAAWRRVKQTLFSPTASPAEKANALDEIRVWHARARKHRVLPAYVEATELLLRCVLQDEQASQGHDSSADGTPSLVAAQPEVLAAAYGAALSRCVHVMTGSFATATATTYRRRAREIGFPEEAVEVRQRVAHGEVLPTLSELRWTCGLVLQYLFQQYWVEQERQIKLMEGVDGPEEGGDDQPTKAASGGRQQSERRRTLSAKKAKSSAAGAAPEMSVEEMKRLLAQLSSDTDADTGEQDETADLEEKTRHVSATVRPMNSGSPHSSRGRHPHHSTQAGPANRSRGSGGFGSRGRASGNGFAGNREGTQRFSPGAQHRSPAPHTTGSHPQHSPHQGSSRGYPHPHRGSQAGVYLQEVASVPTNKVTPHAAAQPNAAQHGATVVRTGTTHTQEANGGRGTVQFYSSVQRKGGAFTDSEAATLRQLGPQRNMQRPRGGGGRAAVGSTVNLTSAGNLSRQTMAAVKQKFTEAEERRRAEDFALAQRQELHRKRTRFELGSSSSSSDDDDDDDGGPN